MLIKFVHNIQLGKCDVGCFMDCQGGKRDLPFFTFGQGTIESCASLCSSFGFIYAGVQNGLILEFSCSFFRNDAIFFINEFISI